MAHYLPAVRVTPGLARAVAEVAEQIQAGTCRPPTPEEHPLAYAGLAELLDERDQQQEAGTAA